MRDPSIPVGSPMHGRVRVAGLLMHPVLLALLIALYTASLVCFALYVVRGDPIWFRAGWFSNAVGVVASAIAALPAFLGWALGVPGGTRSKPPAGVAHMLCNVAALLLFAANLFILLEDMNDAVPELGVALMLPIAGVILTIAAGILGCRLVQSLPGGKNPSPEQELQHSPAQPRRSSLPPHT